MVGGREWIVGRIDWEGVTAAVVVVGEEILAFETKTSQKLSPAKKERADSIGCND